LDLHLGHGEDHRPLAADALVESLGIEGPTIRVTGAAGLRDPQVDLADPGVQGLGLEAVGVAFTIGSL
jgi:hypothetical protein